jgi:prephenate dehydrogenase
MVVTIIGVGLIGGSLAIALKEKGLATRVFGVDNNEQHGAKALELGLVDEMLPLEKAVPQSNLIVIAVPVDAAEQLLPGLLDLVDRQVVMDVGSIKGEILAVIKEHRKKHRFVPTHPRSIGKSIGLYQLTPCGEPNTAGRKRPSGVLLKVRLR